MPDPWFAVEATARRSEKLSSLPSDTARWGWLVMLGEAKLLRRQGTFTPGQWAEVMGRYAKYLPDYIEHGLLHRAPKVCDEKHRTQCLRGRGPFEDGTLIVHDWPKHQREHAARQQDYRERDVPSDAPSDAESDANSDSRSDIPSRALSLSPVDSHLSSGVGYGAGGSDEPEWPALVWLIEHNATVQPNGNGYHRTLIRLTDAHGVSAVIRAMAELGDGLTARQYVLGADNALNPIPSGKPDPKHAQAEADEKARQDYDRRVEQTRRRIAELRGDAA